MIPKELGDLREGDKIAQDLHDFSGNLLLRKGGELNRQIIGLLAQRGIRQVLVESDDPNAIKRFEEMREEILRKVERVFEGKEDSHDLMAIKEAIVKYHKNNFVIL